MDFGSFLSDNAARLIGMAALLVGSAFFSGTETACFSLSPSQKRDIRKHHGGKRLSRLLSRPQSTLNLLLLGNMIVNVAFSATSAVIALNLRRSGHSWQVAAMSLGGLLALILLGEVAPKMLAFTVAPRWALVAAGPLTVLGRILSPVLWVLETLIIMPVSKIIAPRSHQEGNISADELEALLDLSTKRGLLDDDAHALLREIVQLGQLRVADVMSPRVDMLTADIAEPRQHLLDLFAEHRARYIPVYAGDVEHVLGIVFAKHLLTSPETPLADLIVPVPFVPVTARIERVLLQFRQTHHRVGIAVDEYGGTAGLVTLEDILDEIVGDIPRPDAEPAGPAVKAVGGGYLIDGDLAIHEWAEAFNIDLHGGRISTMGGFITSLLGHIAAVGDSVSYRNLRFTVDSLRGRRVGRLRIDLQEEAS